MTRDNQKLITSKQEQKLSLSLFFCCQPLGTACWVMKDKYIADASVNRNPQGDLTPSPRVGEAE